MTTENDSLIVRLNDRGRMLKWSGILLVIVGMIHVPIFVASGESWEGPISWRKPILFGVSTGMTLWSLGWIMSSLRPSAMQRFDRFFSTVVSVSLVVEVALIVLQKWRGTASHFNRATLLDASVDSTMLILIALAVVGIIYFSIRSFSDLVLDADYVLAIRSGMLFLFVSCVIGFVISYYGETRMAKGLSPELVGKAGVPKFPHGVAIHALQMFPFLVYVMRWMGVGQRRRLLLVTAASASMLLMLIFACYQTIEGLGRFELTTVTAWSLLVAAAVIGAGPAIWVLWKQFSAGKLRVS